MTHHPQPAADDECVIQVSCVLVSSARELLARTAELPDSKRELLAILSEYRAALYAVAVQATETWQDSAGLA
jgi:hypothetical protein